MRLEFLKKASLSKVTSSLQDCLKPRKQGARALTQARRRLGFVGHLQALARASADCCRRWRHCTLGPNDFESRCTIKKEGLVMLRTNFKA